MGSHWPELNLAEWQETYATLHLWTQVVGKVCLATTPLVNHYWNATLRVTPRGLRTPLLFGPKPFEMEFDFTESLLQIRCSDGTGRNVTLEPKPVSQFYHEVRLALDQLECPIHIWSMPQEIPDAIPFNRDQIHSAYVPLQAVRFHQTLLAILPTFEAFRAKFIGKCSPVHFFWGSFDLAVTRFSGRRAPEREGADPMTREAYSHEVISHGFWPGGGSVTNAAFYAYAAPEPEGYPGAQIEPRGAYYDPSMKEFFLPYDVVRASADPAARLEAFLNSTYDAAADLGRWDRSNLER